MKTVSSEWHWWGLLRRGVCTHLLETPGCGFLVLVDTDRALLDKIGDKFLLEERLTDFGAMLADETIGRGPSGDTPGHSRSPVCKGAERRQALRLHHSHGHDHRRAVPGHRGPEKERKALYVHGNFRLWAGIPVREGPVRKGELGRIQFMRCAHYQDMEGWPDYWLGFPP